MSYVITPEFLEKLNTLLIGDPKNSHEIKHLLSNIDNYSIDDLISGKSGYSVHLLDDNIYVVRKGNIRVFFTYNDNEEKILLLDILDLKFSHEADYIIPSKNPKITRSINPKFNHSINPKFNRSINPKFNRSINPKFNRSINPKFNRSINPKFNRSINPKFNRSINPKFNRSINPKFNRSINPKFNRGFSGPLIYDLNLKKIGFIIRANENINLHFNNDLEFESFGVKNNLDSYTIFNTEIEWIGYLVSDKKCGFLLYNTDNSWEGFIV